MLIIDGAQGEGGGQILRTSLALSLITNRPFRIERIRANRKTPGLLRQHLTAVNAAAAIGNAETVGAEMGARELTFVPGEIVPGEYRFAVGTAGSALLVMQTVLPPLMLAAQSSKLVIEGGTHNRQAPPFDFIARAFLPQLGRMGVRVAATLERYGFYPAGGGRVRVEIEPALKLKPLHVDARGASIARRARAVVANLDRRIAERELKIVKEKLTWRDDQLSIEQPRDSVTAGNYVSLEIESEHVTEVFTGFGERGVTAEAVAEGVVAQARRYLAGEAAIGEYLADQLLLPMALVGGGSFTCEKLSAHATTNIEIINKFINARITTERLSGRLWRVIIAV